MIQEYDIVGVLTAVLGENEGINDLQLQLLILRAINNFLLQNGHMLMKSTKSKLFELLRNNLQRVLEFVENRGQFFKGKISNQ